MADEEDKNDVQVFMYIFKESYFGTFVVIQGKLFLNKNCLLHSQDSFYDDPPEKGGSSDDTKGLTDEIKDKSYETPNPKEDNVGYEDDFEDETDVKIKLTADSQDNESDKDLNSPTLNINGAKLDDNAISPVSRSRQIRAEGIGDSPPGNTLHVDGIGSNESTPPGHTLKKAADIDSNISTPPGKTLQKAVDDCKEAQEESYTADDYISIFNDSRGFPLTHGNERLFSTSRGIPIDHESIPEDDGKFFPHEPIHTL